MAEETPISSSGASCSWKELKAVSDAKAKAKKAWDDLMAIVDKVDETRKSIQWGKLGSSLLGLGDALLTMAVAQAAAIAQTVAAQAMAALGALIAKAMEALFKYILYMVSFGPAFLTSVMKKPIDRAIVYSNKEHAYLSACRSNIGRIIAIMEEMFGLELLPDYNQKMSESMNYLTKCLESLSSLTAELDSSSYFRKPIYDRAMLNLEQAIKSIKVDSPFSTSFSDQIDMKKQDYVASNNRQKNNDLKLASDKKNKIITKASSDFSSRVVEVMTYYSQIIFTYYAPLLNQKGFTIDDAGARDYINSLIDMAKSDRSQEATKNNAMMTVRVGVSAVSSKIPYVQTDYMKQRSKDDQAYLSNSVSSGYSTKSTIKNSSGVNFSNDLSGCVNAINDAENSKIAKISNANEAYERSVQGIDIQFEARQAGDTARSIYDTFKDDGLKDVMTQEYSDRWSINVKFLQDEFSSLATNSLTAFTFYKKRQACTKGAAFSVSQLKKAFDMIARFMSKNVSGNLASGTSSYVKAVQDNQLQPAMDILSKNVTGAGTSTASSKTKIALDAMSVWSKLSSGELALNAFITQSLVDTINMSKIFEEAELLIDEKVGKIAAIPDWDGGTSRVSDGALTVVSSSAGWIYNDRKRPAPNSPYVKLTKDIAVMSVSAPFNLISGGPNKEALRKKIYGVNEIINKLLQHNQTSIAALSGLDIQENPYVDQAMAQLDKYGMDMLMDMFEAASFASMAASVISGKASYAMAQLQCAKKIQADANTPEVKTAADRAAKDAASQLETSNVVNSNAKTNQEKQDTIESKNPPAGDVGHELNFPYNDEITTEMS